MTTITAGEFLAALGRVSSKDGSISVCVFEDVEIVGDVDFAGIQVTKLFLKNVTFKDDVKGIVGFDQISIYGSNCIFFSSIPALYTGGLVKEFTL